MWTVSTLPGASKKWKFKCFFCTDFNKPGEGNQRAEEHIMACDIHGKIKKGCVVVPSSLRDELRALRGLPPFQLPTETKPTGSSKRGRPTDLKGYIQQQELETLHKKQCKCWYANAVPFALASDIHHKEYMKAIKRAPTEVLAQYKPLDRNQLSENSRIGDAEKEVLLLETDIVNRSGGGYCASTDGGKVGYAATRVVMADCSQGTFWIACYATGDCKKDVNYLSTTLMEKLL